MIIDIMPSNGLTITSDYSQAFPYSSNKSYPVRFNAQSRELEAFCDDTNQWISLGKRVGLGLDPTILELLEWANKKKEDEYKVMEILKKHPEIKKMHDQVDVLIKLIQKSYDEESK